MWVLGIARSPLEEQSVLLTTEPSLSRPQPFVFLRIHPLVFILFFSGLLYGRMSLELAV